MRNTNTSDLNRAVKLLNFEQENMDKAESVLKTKYNIPQYYLSLITHKIFLRLSTYDFSFSNEKYPSIWDQFHQLASEEVKTLRFQH